MSKKILYCLILLLSQGSIVAYAMDNHSQRELFWQARQALLAKQYQQFGRLSVYLKNYPLYPYLLYMKLSQQPLAYQKKEDIDDFLENYKDTPLAPKLRAECLLNAAKKKDWTHFIYYYKPLYGTHLQCYYLNALLATKQKRLAYQAIPQLWLSLNAPPSVCQSVFSHWEKGGLNSKLLWQKLTQAIQHNNVSLIQHLAQFLPATERQQVKLWYRVHHHPLLIEQNEQFDPHDKIDRKILLYGMQRLANRDPDELVETWPLLTKIYSFTEAEKQNLLRILAISLARRADFSASDWLKQVKPSYADSVLREWRVRHALLQENWPQTLYWINKLSSQEQKLPCWRYWRARALAATHQTQAATPIYQQLAQEVD